MEQEKKMPREAWVKLCQVIGYLERAKIRANIEIGELEKLRKDAEEKEMWGYVASLRTVIGYLKADVIHVIEMASEMIERLTQEYRPGG